MEAGEEKSRCDVDYIHRVFSVQDHFRAEEIEHIAHQAGCSEAEVRGHLMRLQTKVRLALKAQAVHPPPPAHLGSQEARSAARAATLARLDALLDGSGAVAGVARCPAFMVLARGPTTPVVRCAMLRALCATCEARGEAAALLTGAGAEALTTHAVTWLCEGEVAAHHTVMLCALRALRLLPPWHGARAEAQLLRRRVQALRASRLPAVAAAAREVERAWWPAEGEAACGGPRPRSGAGSEAPESPPPAARGRAEPHGAGRPRSEPRHAGSGAAKRGAASLPAPSSQHKRHAVPQPRGVVLPRRHSLPGPAAAAAPATRPAAAPSVAPAYHSGTLQSMDDRRHRQERGHAEAEQASRGPSAADAPRQPAPAPAGGPKSVQPLPDRRFAQMPPIPAPVAAALGRAPALLSAEIRTAHAEHAASLALARLRRLRGAEVDLTECEAGVEATAPRWRVPAAAAAGRLRLQYGRESAERWAGAGAALHARRGSTPSLLPDALDAETAPPQPPAAIPFFPVDQGEMEQQQIAMMQAGVRLPDYLFRGFACV
ncbi:hypothetical protein ACKKBG_A37920 [Auxenochlorella protothecoides x Auxenochlorella symbiontica]